MFAVPAAAQSPTTLMLSPSVLSAGAAVNAVTTRQTAIAAPAPLSDQPAGQYGQDNAQSAQEQISSQALTQSAAQQENTDSVVSLATADERVAPAPEYNMFVGYGFIKYKPSDAGIPQLSLPFPSAAADTTEAASPAAASEYQAYSDTQARNRSNLFSASSQLSIAG